MQLTYKQGISTLCLHPASGLYFHEQTADEVKAAIVALEGKHKTVRLFLGDVATGQSWQEENDVAGYLARSTGPCKVPLLCSPRGSGGFALLDHCIVGIKTANGWAYKHPGLSLGTWAIVPPVTLGYVEAVHCNGKLHAQFKKPGQAARYITFMTGQRLTR